MKPEVNLLYNSSHLDNKIKNSMGKTANVINSPFTSYISDTTTAGNTQLQPKMKLISDDFRNPKHYIDEDLNVKIVKTPRGLQIHSRSKYISPRLSNSAPIKFVESVNPKESGKNLEDRLAKLNLKMNEVEVITPRSKQRFSATEEYKRQQHIVNNEHYHNYLYHQHLHNLKYAYDDLGSLRGGSLDSYRLHTIPPALAAYYSNRIRTEDEALLGNFSYRSLRPISDLPSRVLRPSSYQAIYPPYFNKYWVNDSLSQTYPQQKNNEVYEERKRNGEEKMQGSVVESVSDLQNDEYQRQEAEEDSQQSGNSYAKLRKDYLNRKIYGEKSEFRY